MLLPPDCDILVRTECHHGWHQLPAHLIEVEILGEKTDSAVADFEQVQVIIFVDLPIEQRTATPELGHDPVILRRQ